MLNLASDRRMINIDNNYKYVKFVQLLRKSEISRKRQTLTEKIYESH